MHQIKISQFLQFLRFPCMAAFINIALNAQYFWMIQIFDQRSLEVQNDLSTVLPCIEYSAVSKFKKNKQFPQKLYEEILYFSKTTIYLKFDPMGTKIENEQSITSTGCPTDIVTSSTLILSILNDINAKVKPISKSIDQNL